MKSEAARRTELGKLGGVLKDSACAGGILAVIVYHADQAAAAEAVRQLRAKGWEATARHGEVHATVIVKK